MSRFLITAEGIEGSGKSTQVRRLADTIASSGQAVVATKEPGGTPIGDQIRAILLNPSHAAMDSVTELFLYAASRRQHVYEVIRPALDRGAIVVCDRFTDATLAYQGFGRVLELDRLRSVNEWATGGLTPDLTLLFDLPEEIGLTRAVSRNAASAALRDESRFEEEDLRFHRRVREGYLALALAEPARFVTINGEGTIDQVAARVVEALEQRAPHLLTGVAR